MKPRNQRNHPENAGKTRRPFRRLLALALAAVLLGFAGTLILVETRPAFGAEVAGRLRDVFGPRFVAGLETIVFRAQDALEQWRYRSGVEQAEAPWEAAATTTPAPATPTPSPQAETATPGAVEPTPAQSAAPSATPTTTPDLWEPPDLAPFGDLAGEGVWGPYLYDRAGEVVAMRTFLQPDPDRPYAIVAVVAIDLDRADLHFVLGFNDPALPDGPKGDGRIPEADRQASVLLAAFNGGFRAINGFFGAMAGGVVALPPIDGLATVGIYRDGSVAIGAWGEEITDDPELAAWRQNCPLVIRAGAITPQVYNDSIVDWGGTISNQIVTRRSGLGLDAAGRTLYYFAGPSLSMPALADAMLAAG
ncbi:MAG TPA: hypothetical protein VMN57_11400, partial [Anaerolineales bacterium]|nr:hypothetical protein [Anaerolineales bacterium]